MKVYAHYIMDTETKIEYRWRTLLQFDDSWEIIGSVYMKNPGQAYPLKEVSDTQILCTLQSFDDKDYIWYLFKEDITMRCIECLFQEYAKENHLPFKGVVQIFNLFNVRDADLTSAIEKCNRGHNDKLETIEDDLTYLVAPIYIGWGNLGKSPQFVDKARLIFERITQSPYNQHYLSENFYDNSFYHPLSLMRYLKNNYLSKRLRLCFFQNTSSPKGLVALEEEMNQLQIMKKYVKTIKCHYRKEEITPFDAVWIYNKYVVVLGKQYPYAIDIIVKHNAVEVVIQKRGDAIAIFPKLENLGFIRDNERWNKARYYYVIESINLDEIFKKTGEAIKVIKELKMK